MKPRLEISTMDQKSVQRAAPKKMPVLLTETEDDLHRWSAIYFETQVTTSPRSQKELSRDLSLFLTFMEQENGHTLRSNWSPRLGKNFLTGLRNTFKEDGARKWSDRTINRMTAHLKTFAKWIHTIARFLWASRWRKSRCSRSAISWRSNGP
jgi:hypothetical protein